MRSFRGLTLPVVAVAAVLSVLAGIPAAQAARHGGRAASATAAAGVISTVAGGMGGPGTATSVAVSPVGVTFGDGSLYVTDQESVRQVSPATGQLTTPAGNGAFGPLGNGGLATKASLLGPAGMAVDGSGNLVIAEPGNRIKDQTFVNRVRVMAASTGTFYGQAMKAGHIYTVAGNGTCGSAGDGGPATSAALCGPYGVAVDGSGNLVIADQLNNRVRVVAVSTGTFYGQAMTAGDIYTVAGTGTAGYSGNGGPATSAELDLPASVAVDAAGNLVIADQYNSRVRVVAVSTGRFYRRAMTAGDIYSVAGNGKPGFAGDGGPAGSAELKYPADVVPDRSGNLVIADGGNSRVRVVAFKTGTFYGQAMTAGDIYTVAGNGTTGFAGDGGPAASAELNHPSAVAIDGSGNLVLADSGNSRVRVMAASTGTSYGQAMTAGDIYTIAGNGSYWFSGDGGPATQAQLGGVGSAVADGQGNLVLADSGNNRVRVVAASTGTSYGQAMTAGDIYTVAGTGKRGFSGDGGPATGAKLNYPADVMPDGQGNLVVADSSNNRVRLVAASTGTFYGQAMTAGDIYTIAGGGTSGLGDGGPATSARLRSPDGVGMDATGNLLIADSGDSRVRVVAASTGTFYGQAMTAGDIYTIAGTGGSGFSGDGGPAVSARLSWPSGVATDAAGNLVIADQANNRVRVVAASTGTFYGQAMTAGDIYTVAGDGRTRYSGDGGPAVQAAVSFPVGVAVDPAGNLLVSEIGDSRVRVVAPSTGTFYGQAMTAGDIYTVAGDGKAGFSGDGGPATAAEISTGAGVAVYGAGGLLLADGIRVRLVAG